VIEAGIVLDLLDSLALHLTSLDVKTQKRLAESKYKLLTTKVDPMDIKQVYQLASRAFDAGIDFICYKVVHDRWTTTQQEQ